MKKALWGIVFVFCVAAPAFAGDWRPFETTNEARQRHSAERYQTYESRGHQAPLGGYSERLGDPAPRGTEIPGLYSTQPQPRGIYPSTLGRETERQRGL